MGVAGSPNIYQKKMPALTGILLMCPQEAKKGLSRPLKFHHHPMEQTHTNWVSKESSFEAIPSLNLEIAPLCCHIQWYVVEVNVSDDHG